MHKRAAERKMAAAVIRAETAAGGTFLGRAGAGNAHDECDGLCTNGAANVL
jgi:hypothetical protein